MMRNNCGTPTGSSSHVYGSPLKRPICTSQSMIIAVARYSLCRSHEHLISPGIDPHRHGLSYRENSRWRKGEDLLASNIHRHLVELTEKICALHVPENLGRGGTGWR